MWYNYHVRNVDNKLNYLINICSFPVLTTNGTNKNIKTNCNLYKNERKKDLVKFANNAKWSFLTIVTTKHFYNSNYIFYVITGLDM